MRNTILTAAFATLVIPAAAGGPVTAYLGTIPTASTPTGLTTDGTQLFYVNRAVTESALFRIADPLTAIGQVGAQGEIIGPMPFSAASRGLQGVDIDSQGVIYTAGDTGGTTTFIDRWVPDGEGNYVRDLDFRANADAVLGRISGGVAVVSDTLIAVSLLATSGAVDVYFIDHEGNYVSGPVATSSAIVREIVVNTRDNVLYPFRNFTGDDIILEGYLQGINPVTGGGTWVPSLLIEDGANNSSVPIQGGYYDATAHQLINVDSKVNFSGQRAIRFWDISEDGTVLTLAHSVGNEDFDVGFSSINDAVVIGDYLYVSSNSNVVYVYSRSEVPPAGVSDHFAIYGN